MAKRLVVILGFTMLGVLAVSAQTVGLGPMIGVALPQGDTTQDIQFDDWEANLNWGFFVNIPLLSTFHLSPSSEIYKLGDANATDMAMAFKFIVPLTSLDIHAGLVAGLTAVSETIAPHVGILAGLSFDLVSNLDILVATKYKVLFNDGENVRILHAGVGLLFQF